MSAPSPRPNAFRGIRDHLLCKLCVSLCTFTMYIIENNRLTKTWSFRKANVSRDQALEYLGSKEAAQVRSHLSGECGSLVIHRQQDSFNLETGVHSASNSHQRIEKFRNTFKSQIFTLDRAHP